MIIIFKKDYKMKRLQQPEKQNINYKQSLNKLKYTNKNY